MATPATDGARRTVTAPIGTVSKFRSASLTSAAVAVKTTPGTITNIHVGNAGTSAVKMYLHLYDLAQGSVSVGSTVPTYSFEILGGTIFTQDFSAGLPFAVAISAAITTTPSGSTAASPIAELTQIEYV